MAHIILSFCLVSNNDYFGFVLICLNTHASYDRKSNHWENMAKINTKYNGDMGWDLVPDNVCNCLCS